MGNAESVNECTEPIEAANASDELSVTTKPFDLSVLLDGTKLQQSLGTNSEPLEGEVTRHRDQLLSWLRVLQRANEATVSSLQFVEEAVGFGVSRKNASEFFNCVDRYSNGQLQCSSLISALQESSSRSILQACSPCIIAPGAVDVYSEGGAVGMGAKLMQFVQRNRACSDLLSLPGYEASLTQFSLREKLVHSRYINWKNSDEDRDKSSDDKGQQLMEIKKCFSKITASSNDRSIDNLLDNNASTYWQSNGSPRRHWIRLHMLPGVMVKELAITVNQSDDSYMPKKVAILVGSTESNLRDLKEVEVPRNLTGKFVIAKAIRSYRYVQINIRGCHSDGCDTRIRGISVKGYKFVEEKKPLVLDTLVTWHLSLLASTALSSVETAPALRDILITQSSVAFKQLKPLILSSSSVERPEFLSSFVVTEISRFLHMLCLEQSRPHNIAAMETLLYFSVATGNLNDMLHSLRLLLANSAQQLVGVAELLLSIDEILLWKRRAHAEQLKLTVATCSGGHSEQASNIITNQLTSGTAYSSKSGKTDVLFSFKDKEDRHFIVYKLIVKVPSGDHGAKEGFVLTASSPDEVQQLESIDLKDKPSVNHFTIDTDTHMAEVTLTTVKADKLLLIRFLSSESSADHVSIHCVQPFGYVLSDRELWCSDNIPLPLVMPSAGEAFSGADILSSMLSLLIRLVQDRRVLWQRLAHNQMDTTLSVEAHVEVEQLRLQEVWLLYQQLIGQKEAIQCLQLLHCCLPFLEAKRKAKNSDIATEVLKHLCSVVDKEVEYSNDVIEKMAHDIILDGIVVFFPDSSARRSHLISMLDCVMSKELPTSWWVKFEALCVHFSSQDPSALLGLKVTNDSNTEALVILKTIVTIVTRDALSMKRPRCSDLVQLLGSLQATLFFWCQTEWEGKSNHTPLIGQYIVHFADNCLKVLQKVSAQDDKLTVLNYLQQSLLATVLPQLLYLINSLRTITDLHQVAMRNLFPLVKEIYSLTTTIPELSMGMESSGIESNQSEAIIDVKVIESSHNYNNSVVISEEFNFEEASQLIVEFDSRCSTEADCDVLTFADAQGTSKRCHGKVGTDTWPKTLQFQGGKLTFTFHSDSSNTDWGYRFCIKVYSKQKKSFHWLFDLQLSLTRLLGQLCSSALAEAAIANDNKSKQNEEEILVRSDVWKTLFRGGYQTNKLTRSLSGAHSTMPSESRLNEYLMDMANGVTPCSLLKQCHLGQQGVVPPQYGGAVVDKTINAIFASLIWHCQELRDEVTEFVLASTLSPRLSPRLLKVYSIAQDMRRELVEARRKVMNENEGETSEEVNEDTPIIACREKALFLLNFSGLTKVTGAHMQQVSPSSRSSWLRKSLQWRKMGSIDGKSSMKLSHQVSIVEDDSKDVDPSIKMVLDFVKDERITKDLVHSLLQHRSKRAKTISYIFTFCAEFIQLFMPHIFQLPVIVFLQQLLSQQQGFPPHYAAKLDGCGLEKENDVRKAYYLLLTKIIDAVRSCRSQEGTTYPASYYLVKSYLLHLLDIDWQDYDNLFILEQELPELFLETAITSFKPTDKVDVFPMETELMERYQLQSKLRETLLELKSFTKVMEHCKDFEPQKELHYFLVTAIHVVPNVIMVTCDGCSARISSQWYRSLESSESCDLCETCFNDGTGSRPDDHTKEHLFIRLGRFICDGCRMLITSHRFHSNTKDDYDLCLGCYRANGGHGDQWTYYPMTIIPKTDKRNSYYSINPEESEGLLLESNTLLKPGKLTNIRTYNHQHAMLLFSSLCLDISNKVTASKKSSTANSEYRQSAVTIHLNCLKLLTFCLRASLSGAEENAAVLKVKEKEEAEAAVTDAVISTVTDAVASAVTSAVTDAVTSVVTSAVTDAVKDDVTDAISSAFTDVTDALTRAATDAVTSADTVAVTDVVSDAVTSVFNDVDGTVTDAVTDAITNAVKSAVTDAVTSAVTSAFTSAVKSTVKSAVKSADAVTSINAVTSAVTDAVTNAVTSAVTDAITDAVTSAVTDAVTDAVTSAVTDAVTNAVTNAATSCVTSAVTNTLAVADTVTGALTSAITNGVTYAVTDNAVNAVTDAVTDAVNDAVTSAFTDAVTGAVTDAVTSAFTDAVTSAVTDAVTSATAVTARKTKEQKSGDNGSHGDTITLEVADEQLRKQMSHDDKSSHEPSKKSSHEPDKLRRQKALSNNHQTTLQSLHDVTSQDKQTNSEESFGAAEKHFSFTSLEKILGLLACLIPSEASLSYWSSTSRIFLIDRLLPVLLNISQCCHIRPQQQLQAILIVARYVSKLKPQEGDKVVMETEDTYQEDGVKLVQYFFTLGANYLSKSDFSGAAAVADVLNILCSVTTWKKVVTVVISHCFNIPKKVELPSLFGLLVTAGFPRLLRVGSIVQVANSDNDKCVVTDISSSQSVTCVNITSRTLTVAPHKDLEMSQSSIAGCANISQLQDILHLLNHLKLTTAGQSSQAVELNWMASLLLKSIFIILQQNADNRGGEVIKAILDANILATIVQWASQPTHLSQKWLLSDLEVLSVHLYQPHADNTVTIEPKEVLLPQQPMMSRSSSVKENDPLVGLPADVKEIITNMQEAFNCSFAVLRAMYEMADQDLTKWMELVQGSYDDGALRPSEEAVAKSKEWEPASVREVVQQIQDSANDNGVLLFTPINTDLKNMVATDESSSTLKVQLMSPPTASGTNRDSQHREREESHELLQAELKKDNKSSNRDDMLKVNKALVVLHSRQFLASLLAQWENSSIPLSCSLLGGINVMQLFCLLDLLVRSQYNDTSDKILHSLVSCGVDEELQQLSLTAAQCMGEVSVGNKYCTSKHPLAPSDDVIIDHVTIPNASSLSVTFDSKCNLAGELVLASDEAFTKHVKTYKNSAPWSKHIIPGDTVFYKVTTGESCDRWGWGFTIIGSQVGRFETGYMLLSNLLHQPQDDNKRILPLKKLWPWLAAVACQHTGCRRLQTVKLLMELLHMQQFPTTHASLAVAENTERVELAVLKPLWQLYTKMLKKYEDDSQQGNTPLPQIVRALTELFLLVENVAEDWGMAQDHLIDMLTTEGLNTWLEKGISNVALVSIALGLDNTASKQFLEAKRNYVPTEKFESNDDTSSDETKSSSSSSDDENSFDDDEDNDYLYSGSSSS